MGFTKSALLSVLLAGAGAAQSYRIDTIPTPPGLDPQIGGMAFLSDGRLAACFHRGEVYLFDPKSERWSLYADGLQEPLGLVVEDDQNLVVMQRAELTRLRDEDGDGRADFYQTICDDFGMSGNYHEFAFGPAVGPDGRYYVGLNVASNGAGIRDEIRGRYEPLARPGRMYACVPYRGWIVAIDGKTGELEPIACGVRSPDGLGFGPDGALYVADNQGDWLGTSKLHRIVPGGFHGHVSSLVWREGWDRGDPLKLSVKELDAMRVRASILFPQGIVANSPTQPVWIPKGALPMFEGQALIGEMNSPRIVRLMLEEVAGWVQGATVNFLDGKGLPGGVHRLAFDADGALWTGHTALSWAGGKGMRRTTFTGEVPMEVQKVSLTDDGFAFTFTKPVDPSTAKPAAFDTQRYWYAYHRKYGSDRMGQRAVKVESVQLSNGNRTATIKLAELRSGRVHQFKLAGIQSADGKALGNALVCYTLDRLRDGTAERPQWAEAEQVEVPPSEPVNVEKSLKNGSLVLQAEKGSVVGAAIAKAHNGSRGGYVDYGAPSGERIQFTLQAKRSHEFGLTIRHALGGGGKRTLVVELNGKKIGSAPCTSSGGWERWHDESFDVTIRLPKGEHQLAFVTNGSSGPNVDEFRLTAK